MRKVTIITGADNSNKAKELTEDKKAVWLQSLSKTSVKGIEFDTEVVGIDELSINDMKKLKAFISVEFLTFRAHYAENPISITRPELIAITNCLDKCKRLQS